MKPHTVIRLALLAAVLACSLAAASEAAGAWDCAAITPDGDELKFTLTVKDDGGKFSGNVDDGSGQLSIIEPKFESSTLEFKLDYDGNRHTLALKIAGDKLEGTYSGGGASGKIKGTRKQ